MNDFLARFRRVRLSDRCNSDIQNAKEEIEDVKAVDDIVGSIIFYLERNADLCPILEGTNVRFYKAKRHPRGYQFIAHIFVKPGEVEICELRVKKFLAE
ncbi:MAG: hypothetical protein ABII79_13920 [bacterium]